VSGPDRAIRRLLGAAFGPTRRDRQVAIGPSGVGDPCDYCVARLMAARLTGAVSSDGGSLATWIGSAIHEYLEHRLTGPDAPPELADMGLIAEEHGVVCGYIEGYGEIKGSPDLYVTLDNLLIDWKGTKKDKIKKYKLHGVPMVYDYQKHLYAKGENDNGRKVEWVANVFIPRDGFSYNDCWWDITPYDPQAALNALRRAEVIWNDYVVPGEIEELASDDDCWTCNMSEFMKLNQEGLVILNNGEEGNR